MTEVKMSDVYDLIKDKYIIIPERRGVMVRVKVVKTYGFLWWKKSLDEYRYLNAQGKPDIDENWHEPFREWEDALKWVVKLETGC